MSAPQSDTRFTKARRLLTASDFKRVFDQPDARVSHRCILLLARRNGHSIHRLGFVLARKHVRLSVQRNRIKRVSREFFRALPQTEPPMDVVLLARKGLDELNNEILRAELHQLWHRLIRNIDKGAAKKYEEP